MSTITCPHCSSANPTVSSFCESCGKALPSEQNAGPQIVRGEGVAKTDIGRDIQSQELRKAAGKARTALIAVGVLQLVVGFGLWALIKSKAGADPSQANAILAVVAGIGVVFLGLGIWAKSKPLPAAIIGLVLYVSLHLLDAVFDPAAITRGIILKVIIVVVLVKAIKAGMKHRELQNEQG